jgi:hypothetical protein
MYAPTHDQRAFEPVADFDSSPRRWYAGGWLDRFWAIVILCLPFNVFGPGNPQPADFLMVGILCAPVVLTRYSMPPAIARPVLSLMAFVGYVIACNFVWIALTSEFDFFKATSFYTFNFFIFVGYLVMLGHRGDDWLRWTFIGFAASLVMLAALSIPFSHRAESGRLELFFANPNQLAYHVLLCATVVIALAPRYRMPKVGVYALLLCAFYLELRTYSRAGSLGIALLGVLEFARRPTLVTILLVPVFVGALYFDLQNLDADLWQSRLALVEQSTTQDYLTDRGLDRIVDHPQYLIFGAGEGHLIRFHHLKQEIHSSAANLLFSYGIVGTLLFLVFLRWLLLSGGLRISLLLIPALMYSLFHHGMRARPFWLVLAIALAIGVLSEIDAARARNKAPLSLMKS